MASEIIIELQIYGSIIGVIACLVMIFVCTKRRDLYLWCLAYIIVIFGQVFSTIVNAQNAGGSNADSKVSSMVTNMFYVIAIVVLFIAVFKEYSETFLKGKMQSLKRNISIAAISVSPIVVGMEIFIIIMCVLNTVLCFKIFWKKRTLTHSFFCLILAAAIMIITITILDNTLGVENVRIYGQATTLTFDVLLLVTPIVALLEQKVLETVDEKNILKDRYSHDLGNILHTITMAYDLFNMEHSAQVKKEDLDTLIKGKITEASKLVKFIRNI